MFDLEKTEYVSSVFLRVVLMTAKQIKPGLLKVAKANQFVKDLFRTSGLDQLLKASGGEIESVMQESRVFMQPEAFAAAAHLKTSGEYLALYRRSIDDPDGFWAEQAGRHLVWDRRWNSVREWKAPSVKWFAGGRLNASVNCLDRHLDTGAANKAAIIWEGEPASASRHGEERVLTYRQLHRLVCQFANVLKSNGVRSGDRVLIYLPMVPEAAVAMLACARIGAVHSVVFGGFSAQSVADRVRDSGAVMIVTADGSFRKGAVVQLKKNVDDAFKFKDAEGRPLCGSVRKVIVLRRAGNDVNFDESRDAWWHREMEHVPAACAPESMESEDTLFILYTSGSTGRPKGIQHSTAGFLLGAKLTHHYVFDHKDLDIY